MYINTYIHTYTLKTHITSRLNIDELTSNPGIHTVHINNTVHTYIHTDISYVCVVPESERNFLIAERAHGVLRTTERIGWNRRKTGALRVVSYIHTYIQFKKKKL